MTFMEQMEFASSVGPTVVTLLFVALFAGTLIWIYRPGSNRHYDHQAHLPLEDVPLEDVPLEDDAARFPDPEKRNG
jgi:cbb3-type cytochrome oxidase subunit 3